MNEGRKGGRKGRGEGKVRGEKDEDVWRCLKMFGDIG